MATVKIKTFVKFLLMTLERMLSICLIVFAFFNKLVADRHAIYHLLQW